MKTSIKSRLFLITYGVILAFIVGLIVLNNTYLESYYTNYREKTLIFAFNEVKELDLSNPLLATSVLEIENDYNLNIHILKEEAVELYEFPRDLSDLPIPYERIYGNQYSIHDGMIAGILVDFNNHFEESPEILVNPIQVTGFDSPYQVYVSEIIPTQNGANLDFQMLGLFVQKTDVQGFNIYYILTLTFQSIQDSIDIFNSFTIVVGFLFMILAGFVMYFTSYRFTNPILQMTEVAQELANLNFNKRVDIYSNDEIGILGESINKMSAQLEASIKELKSANVQLSKDIELKNQIDTMRKEFIASASHELKTPISLIMGYSEALKLSNIDQNTIEEYSNIIIDESKKMNKLVMAMLKMTQLESGFTETTLRKFDIKDLIEETLRLFMIKFEEDDINLKVDIEDVEVLSDYDQLQTVLSNYIENALHYVDANKKIHITASLKKDEVIVSVANSGKQISNEDRERIWDSFYKVDKARTRSYGGQGLGLSIVKTTLTNLGYRYGVENTVDGVQFFFTIKR